MKTASPTVEQSVVGKLLNAPHLLKTTRLTEDDFTVDLNRRLFAACQHAMNTRGDYDPIQIAEQMPKHEQTEVLNTHAIGRSITRFNAYEKMLLEYSLRRRIDAALAKASETLGSDETAEAQLDSIQRDLNMLRLGKDNTGEPVHIKDAARELVDYLSMVHETGGLVGTSTGFSDLDKRIRGMQAGDFIVVAGRPSMGKTTFALNIADFVAVTLKQPALVFSMEMSRKQVMLKMAAARANLLLDDIMSAKVFDRDHDAARLTHAMGVLSDSPLFIDDSPALTVNLLAAKARRVHANHKLGVIVVDYIGLMRGDGRHSGREQEISSISGGLKALGKELGVPVVALAQLNRGVEQRDDKRPLLSDLRDSGSIEQDADIVWMLYRDEYYNSGHNPGVLEVLTRKFRMGKTGVDFLAFAGGNSRMNDLHPEYWPKADEPAPKRSGMMRGAPQ